jgi:hypothetical protein
MGRQSIKYGEAMLCETNLAASIAPFVLIES